MNDATLYERMLDGMEAFFALVGDHSPQGRTLHLDGVLGSVCPAVGDRSFFNSVVYRDTGAMCDALAQLDATYDQAGVDAWTVWTPEQDAAARAALQRAGHVLDATPRAMAAPLEEIDAGNGGAGVDWEAGADLEEMWPVFAEAFAIGRSGSPEVLAGLRGRAHLYLARVGGAAAATTVAIDVGGDCTIQCVGTVKSARGRGLASALMRQALLDARERGADTTSLQATAMGRPIYRRLGYRELGVIDMWERRRPLRGRFRTPPHTRDSERPLGAT